jgi:hypothetical protein
LVSTVDLHMHTFYSDGRGAPEAMLRWAAALGIQTVAITDHDNTNGVRQAQALAPKLGLCLIPAIELTCRWDQCRSAPGEGGTDRPGARHPLPARELRAPGFPRSWLIRPHRVQYGVDGLGRSPGSAPGLLPPPGRGRHPSLFDLAPLLSYSGLWLGQGQRRHQAVPESRPLFPGRGV